MLLAGETEYSTQYALFRAIEDFTTTGNFNPDVFDSRKEEFESRIYENDAGQKVPFSQLLDDQYVVTRVSGKGGWLTDGKNDVPDADIITDMKFTAKDKSLIIAAVDLAQINPDKRDKLAATLAINEALERAGVYVIADASFGRAGKLSITRSRVVPEAVGISTAQINKALDNRRSTVDRYLGAYMSGGEAGSVWDVAADYLQTIRIDEEDARSLITREELIRRKNAGEARIVLGTADHNDTGVPVRLMLLKDGVEVPYTIGEVNFGNEINTRFFKSGLTSKAFKAPRKPSTKADQVYRSSGFYVDISPNTGG